MIPSISPFWGRKCSILCGLFLSGAISLVTQSCPTLCDPMDCSMPGLPVHHQFQELAQTHVYWVSDANPIFPRIRVFSNKSVLRIRGLKYWSFSVSISPSNEYSRLISFRIDWFALLFGERSLSLYTEMVLLEPSSRISLMKPQSTCERKKKSSKGVIFFQKTSGRWDVMKDLVAFK